MAKNLVNARSARYCCRDCYSEYGGSDNRKDKNQFKRMIRSREKQEFKKSLRHGDY